MDKLNCLKRKKPEESREIGSNDPQYNAQFHYEKNKIITSRYNILTFLPLNLFQQFQRVANAYFLMLVILQLIPQISSLNPITTIVPLVMVLALTAIKDAWDDFHRHKSDNEINNRKTLTLRNNKLDEVKWMNVCVGDIIKLKNNDFVTADILLLSSSDENNLIYIETAELDGETNLKVRQALPETGFIGDNVAELSSFHGHISCEAPNEQLHKFIGTLTWRDKVHPIDNDKILLRGCRLRNTDWCIGLVIFAGPDTKLMQNTGKTVLKRTSIDRLMNTLVWMIFGFLITLATITAIGNTIWESQVGISFQAFQPWESYRQSIFMSGFLTFWSYIIILNTVVPISLYVSVEIIRVFQSLFIEWDREMYYEKKDLPACVRTKTLNEELGQIEYIFTDKTGTLTQNVMEFNKCTINGQSYGSIYDSNGNRLQTDENTPMVDLTYNPLADAKFHFYDSSLVEKIQKGDENCFEFFRLIALCHTVMPEYNKGILTYQAQSPDESALVSAARNFGFVFTSRTYNTVTVKEMGKDVEYEVYAILDFDNVRKRMSVIVRNTDTGRLTLYCKGADTVIYERLKRGHNDELTKKTYDQLEDFATDGLRTLCLAKKDLSQEEYEVWKAIHENASKAFENHDELLAAAYEEIERDMILLGATAIEDKLQDGVPETIANLAKANIKIWVLTGDKQETAINIGYSCNMLTEDFKDVFVISGTNVAEVKVEMEQAYNDIQQSETNQNGAVVNGSQVLVPSDESQNSMHQQPASESSQFGLVINGQSLAYALDPSIEKNFLDLASSCISVICCRVTPLQKAQVVELVKKWKSAVTLSIGDGANDVSMIKAAHIGVGISGEEGTQAVLSADFAFGQFRYLERLLLVHGRWSYLRMCKFLSYFFYKNFAFTLVHFWFAFFCGFQAQAIYDEYFIGMYNVGYSTFPVICLCLFDKSIYDDWLVTFYNLVYTAMPVIVLALLDKDLNDLYCIRYPKLYLPGQKNEYFNKIIFFKSTIRGILTSLVLYFFAYGALFYTVSPDGTDISNLQSVGTIIGSSLIIIVNLQVGLDTQYWTAINHFFVWGSIAIFFALTFAMYSDGMYYLFTSTFPFVGVARSTMKEWNMWFVALLVIIICIMTDVAIRLFTKLVWPTYTDKIMGKQLKDRELRKKKKQGPLTELTKFKERLLKRKRGSGRPHSGYAFSHEQGFGELITSGRMSMRRKPPEEGEQQATKVIEDMSKNQDAISLNMTDSSIQPGNGNATEATNFKSDSEKESTSSESDNQSIPSPERNEDPPESYRPLPV